MSDIKAQDNTYVSQIHKKTTIWNEDYGSQRLTSDRLGWESATPPRRNRWAHTRACNCTSSQFRRPRSTCCPSVGSRSWKSLRTHRANTISNLIDSHKKSIRYTCSPRTHPHIPKTYLTIKSVQTLERTGVALRILAGRKDEVERAIAAAHHRLLATFRYAIRS